jgi:GrpB-like predicted nucleotidyltransferase (UPF0157 family)
MQSIDELVHIVEYDPTWPAIFVAEQARVSAALAVSLQRLEHIGSTAVRELPAKPIVDIMLGTDNWPPAASIGQAITGLGYESLGEAGVPERLYFRLRGQSDFNLHVVRFAGHHWQSNIALRDYLRNHEAARIRYGQAKRAAIASGAARLLAYSDAKSPIVANLLEEALGRKNDN